MSSDHAVPDYVLRAARVIAVTENVCEIVESDGTAGSVVFAPMFPTPRAERVSPGHLVAVATGPDGSERVVWRWYDAVVIGEQGGRIRVWEPAHGDVLASPRPGYRSGGPGTRAYASAGLPGASWWICGAVTDAVRSSAVELDEVEALFRTDGLWADAFGEQTEREES